LTGGVPIYMSERFGAWQVGQDADRGPAEFKLFFPDRAKDPSQYESTRKDQAGREIADFGDPKITSIQVAGAFQEHLCQRPWDFDTAPRMTKQPHPKGWVWTYRTPTNLPAGFSQYKYYLKLTDFRSHDATRSRFSSLSTDSSWCFSSR
jgi:pullulanase